VNTDGCFAYKFRDDPPTYFPVVNKPIFTKELLEEELEDTEAWVVVRYTRPALESTIIFDKTKTFEENFYNNAHGLLVSGEVSLTKIGCDKHPSLSMMYEEWASSRDQGSLADPFVFYLDQASNAEEAGNGGPTSAQQKFRVSACRHRAEHAGGESATRTKTGGERQMTSRSFEVDGSLAAG